MTEELKILKSNMDRFIDFFSCIDKDVEIILKSNMDRFIAHKGRARPLTPKFLKSNMDRFIVSIQRRCNEHSGF